MDDLRNFFVIVISSAFLSTNITVFAYREIMNSSEIFSRNETWSKNGVGSLDDSKARLTLCCPLGEAWIDGSCVEDNTTSNILPRIRTSTFDHNVEIYTLDQDFKLFIDDPCAFNWMMTTVIKDFNVLPNGTIYAPHIEEENYCLFRDNKSSVYLAKVCSPWIRRVYWQMCFLILSVSVMIVILIVHSMVPELGNLHGMVFRAYIATYAVTHSIGVAHLLSAESRTYDQLFTVIVFTLRYCACCCALWLNVMSFNIWRSFRHLRSVESHTRKEDRHKFIWYTIYVFSTPAILMLISASVMYYVPYFRNYSLNKSIVLWTCSGLITTVVICNALLHSSTALSIRQYEKDTAYLTRSVNKHYDVGKHWFNLDIKLFIITGCHTLMWVAWEIWPTSVFSSMIYVSEGLRGIVIFVIFIWKANVRRSLRKRLNDASVRLQSTYRRTSTATICGNGTSSTDNNK